MSSLPQLVRIISIEASSRSGLFVNYLISFELHSS